MAGAVGGVVGSILASRISTRLGSGTSLYLSIAIWTITSFVIGVSTRWWVVALWFAFNTVFMILWNIITVSYRQTIIPDALLGRVNSVYRFFGWGMMPIGSLLGGAVVAIADVSHYVVPDTGLDLEAYQRGTSVYFPDRVIPMLPEALSNGLCSLNPEQDRLCLVCELSISGEGQIRSTQFYEAVMRSHARMTAS